ncbi:MAG: ATP-binding cassette domain-containing protein [Kiritimatiellae bacterium]|nr:ATP-binding cassette domain-containing protein [Kiritimatiellia bacterium]
MSDGNDILIKAEHVSKKFCLSLKKSLWYGLKDMGKELLGMSQGNSGQLRPKDFWAVNDVSFEVKRGECLGLIGRNGAGKTTLLKMLNGLIKPDAGRIEMRGRVGALIALGAGFNPVLTGRENIYVNASVLGIPKKEVDRKLDEIVDFAEIGDFIDTPVQNYSSGMAVRLGFAVASSLEPDILLLDEVLAVGDLGFQYKCFRRIGELMKRAAVIFVSHSMASVASTCKRAMLMEHGVVTMASDDCPAVVQRYNALFATSDDGVLEAGRGDAEFTDISVHPAGISPEVADGVVDYGSDVDFDFTLTMKDGVPGAYLTVNILDRGSRQVAQCMSSHQSVFYKNEGKPIHVRMHYPRLPLNPGQYSLWLIATCPGYPGTLAVKHGCCPFQMKGYFTGWLPIQAVVDWQTIAQDGTAADVPPEAKE